MYYDPLNTWVVIGMFVQYFNNQSTFSISCRKIQNKHICYLYKTVMLIINIKLKNQAEGFNGV